MKSIPMAIVWEFWQRGRWGLVGGWLGANALPVLIFSALRLEGADDFQDSSWHSMHVTMMLINMFVFGAAVYAAQGNPSRLYALPVKTSVLVAWHLIPAMVVMALESLASTWALNALFHLGWPLWGPAMFLAALLAAVQAVFWLTGKSAWLLFAMGSVGAALGLWFKSRYGPTFSLPTHLWQEVTPGEVVTMLAIAAVSYYGAVIGIARDRRGDALTSPRLRAWVERVFDPAPPAGLPFQSPALAQFWIEWRLKGWAMPALVAIAIPVVFCIWLVGSRVPKELFDGFLGGGGMLTVMGAVIGLVIGNSGTSDRQPEMGHFMATRPMTDSDMARTILKTARLSILLTWTIWALAFLIVYLVLLANHVVPDPALPLELGWSYFPATLLGLWISVTFTAVLGLAGRPKLILILFCFACGLFFAGMLFSNYVVRGDPNLKLQFHYAMLVTNGAGFMLLTAWAFVTARRRDMIASQTVYIASGIWLFLTALIMLGWALHRAQPVPVYLLVAGLSALVVFPLAAAPLALAWNRHR